MLRQLTNANVATRLMAAVLATALGLSQRAHANIVTWTGADGTDPTGFEVGANWTGGVAPGIPRNNDYSDIARFAETSPANKTPTMSITRSVNGIRFDNSVGWTLSALPRQLTLKTVESSGNGTNTVSAKLKSAAGNYTWTVGENNTLNLTGGFIHDGSGRIIHLGGGGTTFIAGGIQEAYDAAVNTFYIDAGLLKLDKATPYRNTAGNAAPSPGALHIVSENSFLQLLTTVAAAQALIGTQIIDDTSLGLGVTDVGGGYVQIGVIPEPGTVALLGMAMLFLAPRRQRGEM